MTSFESGVGTLYGCTFAGVFLFGRFHSLTLSGRFDRFKVYAHNAVSFLQLVMALIPQLTVTAGFQRKMGHCLTVFNAGMLRGNTFGTFGDNIGGLINLIRSNRQLL